MGKTPRSGQLPGFMLFRLAGINPFWRIGHGWMVNTLTTAADGEWCSWDSQVMVSKPRSNSRNYSFIISIYPPASAPRQVLILSSLRIPWFFSGKFIRLLLAFSLYNTLKKTLQAATPTPVLRAVNGVRVLSLWWVILGHTYYYMQPFLG